MFDTNVYQLLLSHLTLTNTSYSLYVDLKLREVRFHKIEVQQYHLYGKTLKVVKIIIKWSEKNYFVIKYIVKPKYEIKRYTTSTNQEIDIFMELNCCVRDIVAYGTKLSVLHYLA